MVRLLESGGSKTVINTTEAPSHEFRCIRCLKLSNRRICKISKHRKKLSDFCRLGFKNNPYMKFFNLEFSYYKLSKRIFPIIKGASSLKYFKIGDIVIVRVNRKFFCYVRITAMRQKKIVDIPIDYLQHECHYPTFRIYSHENYLDHINNSGPRVKFDSEADHQTIVSIFTVRKLRIGGIR